MIVPEHERVPRIPFKDLSKFREFCSQLGIHAVNLSKAKAVGDWEWERRLANEINNEICEFGDWVDDMLVRP